MAQHLAHSQMRAIEFDRWLAQATNTGYSAVVSPTGQVQQMRLQPHISAWSLASVYPRRYLTPYARWGDWLTPLLNLGAAASILISLGRQGSLRLNLIKRS